MTLSLELNIGLTKRIIIVLISKRYTKYINIKRLQRSFKVALFELHYYIKLKRHQLTAKMTFILKTIENKAKKILSIEPKLAHVESKITKFAL